MAEEIEYFSYAPKVNLVCVNPKVKIANLVAIAEEHGFRACCVNLDTLDELVQQIGKSSDKSIIPISLIDLNNGSNSLDVRNYSIVSSKEKGAKEIIINAPYSLIAKRDFTKVYNDIQSIVSTCDKYNIKPHYLIDLSSKYIDENNTSKLYKIIALSKVDSVVISFSDNDLSENIIKMRNLKSKTRCKISVWMSNPTPEDIGSAIKAGSDGITLDWKTAPSIVESYNNLINQAK